MKTKIIVTLGPSTRIEQDLRMIKARGVDFVRVNMSHSTLADQEYFMNLAEKVGIPFILDTEGSQIRNGDLKDGKIFLDEGDEIKLFAEPIIGDSTKMSLRPASVISQLEEGDLIYIDFNSLVLRVFDATTREGGYVSAQAVTSGIMGSNKAVIIDPGVQRTYDLPPLSPKDEAAIQIAKEKGVEHLAFSFARSGKNVREARGKSGMRIIAKIECADALNNLDEIIREADAVLIDRGDLSKEIPIEKVPFMQKIIIQKAKEAGKEVYVATNLLESMVEKREPTRAEIHDIIATILDGASGLALAAETAIGKYPIEAINTLNKVIRHTEDVAFGRNSENIAVHLSRNGYLGGKHTSALLVEPHGGELVCRVSRGMPAGIDRLPHVPLTDEQYMDIEQIAIGTFSPIEGFMGKDDLRSVLLEMRLTNGLVWPVPIVLDVDEEKALELTLGSDVALTDAGGEVVAILHLEEKYTYDKNEFAEKLYGTADERHPGVWRVKKEMKSVLLSGKITLLKRRRAPHKVYEMTPRQVRRLLEERGWSRIVGFHTRNVPHKGHEFIQMEAMRRAGADGLFVHPVIGKKKSGDFEALSIVRAYELMARQFYPKDKVVFATYATFSRYAGPREALFTALCRKNFGCSHFVVGRDHTGVGDFYPPTASHEIFDRFPDIGITPIRFSRVFYSERLGRHVHEQEDGDNHTEEEKLHISGTEMRRMFERGEAPPEWFMRPEISKMILEMIKNKENVFVK